MPHPNLTEADMIEAFSERQMAYAHANMIERLRNFYEHLPRSPRERKPFAEEVAEAEELGLVVCICLGIENASDRLGERRLIHNPACKVHFPSCPTCGRSERIVT